MTVREALDEKRSQLKGKVESLVLCKRELFYITAEGCMSSPGDTVYPVPMGLAKEEAKFFGVAVSKE